MGKSMLNKILVGGNKKLEKIILTSGGDIELFFILKPYKIQEVL